MGAPISWQPSQYWDGDTGLWSSFALRVGNPGQTVRVIPSTAGISTWVVDPAGCPPGVPGTSFASTCSDSRGGIFNESASDSWHTLSNNSLGIDSNLGYGGLSGLYGLDTIRFDFTDSMGGHKLDSQVVTAIAPEHYFVGLFGLNHQATNLTNFTDPHPSTLTTMKSKDMIPSLSWAYTAGAKYRSKGVFGSLTFGGYDKVRTSSNNFTFDLAPDVTRDLIVGLQQITTTAVNHSNVDLLPMPILAFIDSTQPDFYLPVESCLAVENAFGLAWNATAERYWVDDDLHQNLLTMNPNITLTLGNSLVGNPTTNITLPYAAFDLEETPPAIAMTERYFPLRRAANETQYTLGRTFLQEAYLITDYERSTFSISQANFQGDLSSDIVPIHSVTSSTARMSDNTIIGISTGATVLVSLCILTIIVLLRRLRRVRKIPAVDHPPASSSSVQALVDKVLSVCSMRELGNNSMIGEVRELPNSGKAELQDQQSPSGSGKKMLEIAGVPPPFIHELRTNRSSMDRLMIEANHVCSRDILKSTRTTRESFSSDGPAEFTPFVRTVISATAHEITNRNSIQSHSLKTEIYASYMRRPLDLDRSLPPTPISESPMVSPLTSRFRSTSTLRRRSKSLELTPRSAHTSASRRKATSNANMECMPQILPLTGMEIVIPPGKSDLDRDEISPLSIREQLPRVHWI